MAPPLERTLNTLLKDLSFRGVQRIAISYQGDSAILQGACGSIAKLLPALQAFVPDFQLVYSSTFNASAAGQLQTYADIVRDMDAAGADAVLICSAIYGSPALAAQAVYDSR